MISRITANSPHNKKPPRKIDGGYIERAALYYLERFASSADNLRQVLKRKIQRRCKLRGEAPAEFYPLIEPVIARYIASGLLNDELYARGQVASLRRRGGSARMIAAKMNAKGIKGDTLQTAIHNDETDELEAARNYARRRKLGLKPEKYEKGLASLARAGFSFAYAKAALAANEDA